MTPLIVFLTPVKNEEWIIGRFLECASVWADVIIVADQGSSDRTVEIAKYFNKVRLIKNNSATFNEPERQKLLINEARKIDGPKILIALDADEILSGSPQFSEDWENIRKLEPGTIISFTRVELHPDRQSFWISNPSMLFGFVDDGVAEHKGEVIHSSRLPSPEKAPHYYASGIKVLHYQYYDWERMLSKHRWYQCWERLNFPNKSAIEIFRTYHHMFAIPKSHLLLIDKTWTRSYEESHINMTSLVKLEKYWWDYEVDQWFRYHGKQYFSKLNIWISGEGDPRTLLDKMIHTYLDSSNKFYRVKVVRGFIRIIDNLLSRFW